MYEHDLALNNLESLKCHKTKPNQTKPNQDLWSSDSSIAGELGKGSTPVLSSLPGLLLLGVVAPDRDLSMGQIELNWVLMLNRISWNGTVIVCLTELFKIEMFWHLTFNIILNWIVWIRTD